MGIVILSHIQPNFYQIVPQVPETAPLLEMISFVNNINPQIRKSPMESSEGKICQ